MMSFRLMERNFRWRSPIGLPILSNGTGQSELRDILIKALRELRPALRAVFVLRDIEGLSTAQTADVLNLSHAAVKARLCRGRLQLRERLNMYFREEMESGRLELDPGRDNGTAHLRGGRQFQCLCELYLTMRGSAINH